MFRIRREQVELLAQDRRKAIRQEQIRALRQQGLRVEEEPATGDIIAEDAAGGTARIRSQGNEIAVTSGENRTTHYEYDLGGRLRAIRDPAGVRVVFERDKQDRVAAVHRGSHSSYRFEYDAVGRVAAIHAPDGNVTRFEHGPGGRVTRVVDRNGNQLIREHDKAGRETRFVDWAGKETRCEYDDLDAPASVRHPDGARHDVEFDDGGQLRSISVNGKRHVAFEMDEQAGLLTATYAAGGHVRLALDGDRVVEAANEFCTVKVLYDDEGHVLAEEVDGRKVQYRRDAVGNLVGITTPDGDQLCFHRDKEHRVREIVDWAGGTYRIRYDPSGALAGVCYPNGTEHAIACSALGLPESLTIRSPAHERPLVVRRWTYDPCDRVMEEAREGDTWRYSYDREGRLTAALSSGSQAGEKFTLDANGNRLADSSGPCRVNDLNQLVGRGTATFRYDELGNMTAGPCPSGAAEYRYNGRGQLIAVRIADREIRYAYDPFGRRIRKVVDGRTTTYCWAGWHLLYEITVGGARTSRCDYLNFPERHVPLAMRQDGRVSYVHAGRRAEPLCVTDAAGRVVWRAEYSAYGQASVFSPGLFQPWRLAGQYYDEETGLHYVTARYYHPELGRFLTPDPLRAEGGSFNFYAYCDGDPINRADPSGEFIFVAIVVGAVIGAAIGAGVEAYRQKKARDEARDTGQPVPDYNWGKIGIAAGIGGLIGAAGGGVGAAFEAGAAALGASAFTMGLVGGIASSATEQCLERGKVDAGQLLIDGLVGGGIGAVTAGVGGFLARRARKVAQEAAEAAQVAVKKTEKEVAEAAAKKAEKEAAEAAAKAAAKKEMAERVEQALVSSDSDRVLEGRVAKLVGDDLESFNKKIGPHGAVGETDVETSKAIIEVTTSPSGKLPQVKKLLANPEMNPSNKPVILYAPNYTPRAAGNVLSQGAIVVRSDRELLKVLSDL